MTTSASPAPTPQWWTAARARRRSVSRWSRPGPATPSWCTPGKPSRSWGGDATLSRVDNGVSAMEALYPFLYSDGADLADLMAEVRESTLAKAKEIAELRNVVAAREATRLANCAEDMAARFAAGGRLFACRSEERTSELQSPVHLVCR